MKKEERKEQMKMQLLQPNEMLLIRAGGNKKPSDPKSPDEGIMML